MIDNTFSRLCLAVGVCLGLVSCFETKQDFTLNPDGSGKVVHESKFQPFNMNFGFGGEEPSEEEKMRQAVASILEKAEGVDAWDHVHFERLDDGRILFRGTAWFPDIAKLKIENQMMMEFQWARDPSGNGELAMVMDGDDEDDDGKKADENTPPDDEEGRRKWLAAERGKFQQARPMMASMLTGMRHTATFRLPGNAVSAHQFTDADDGLLSITFDGDRFFSTVEELIADDEWLLEHGFSGDDGPALDDELMTALFGKPGAAAAVRGGLDSPLFDYQAELAAARANADALAGKIGGAAAARVMPPSEGGPLKDARVVGIRLGAEVDPALELRPFNHDAGLTLSVLCVFDGAILSIDDKSALETATTDNGTSLLPKSDFQRRLRFPKLSPGNTHALFDVNLDTPPAGSTRLRDVAGTLHYSVAGDTKELDLGIAKIEKDQRGDEFGAEITDIKPGWNKDGPLHLLLRLNMRKDGMDKAFLVTGAHRHEFERRGHSSSGNITTFTLELPKDYDSNSRIVVEVYDEIRNFTAPFILRDIALPALGAP